MQPIVLHPVKVAGWGPAPFRFPSPSLGQAGVPSVPAAPARVSLIDSPIFNFFVDGLGAFATGSLAFHAGATKATTAATLLGIVSGGLGIMALYNLSRTGGS